MPEAAFPRLFEEISRNVLNTAGLGVLSDEISISSAVSRISVKLREITENLNMSVPAVRPSGSEQFGRVDYLSRPGPKPKFPTTRRQDRFSDRSKHPPG